MIPICLCVYFPLCEPLSHTQSAVMLRANREAEWVDEEDDLLFKYAQEPPPSHPTYTCVSCGIWSSAGLYVHEVQTGWGNIPVIEEKEAEYFNQWNRKADLENCGLIIGSDKQVKSTSEILRQ